MPTDTSSYALYLTHTAKEDYRNKVAKPRLGDASRRKFAAFRQKRNSVTGKEGTSEVIQHQCRTPASLISPILRGWAPGNCLGVHEDLLRSQRKCNSYISRLAVEYAFNIRQFAQVSTHCGAVLKTRIDKNSKPLKVTQWSLCELASIVYCVLVPPIFISYFFLDVRVKISTRRGS